MGLFFYVLFVWWGKNFFSETLDKACFCDVCWERIADNDTLFILESLSRRLSPCFTFQISVPFKKKTIFILWLHHLKMALYPSLEDMQVDQLATVRTNGKKYRILSSRFIYFLSTRVPFIIFPNDLPLKWNFALCSCGDENKFY